MLKIRLYALAVFALGALTGWFLFSTSSAESKFPFRLGLDLSGGVHLVYRADTQNLEATDVADSMSALRDTIERRVNLFGVAEPIVQTERASTLSGRSEERLIVELPGVTDTQRAIEMIGRTPVLEFRLQKVAPTIAIDTEKVNEISLDTNNLYENATVTGKHLTRTTLEFGSNHGGGLSNEPLVVLHFNPEGSELFHNLTKDNVGRVFGIFLDGSPISTPVIRDVIPGGTAVISGGFKPDEARELVRNLNYGALPVPISLVGSKTVGASLGADTLERGIKAGLWGFLVVLIFMIIWYRLPGVIAGLALLLYVGILLSIFKLIPVTLTAAGIAGFILSIGMAVDANVLVFERLKEELAAGKLIGDAVRDGFARAWLAIRDGHGTSLISAIILFWFGTSVVQGFALVFGIGVLASLFTALSVSRTLLLIFGNPKGGTFFRSLFKNGFSI